MKIRPIKDLRNTIEISELAHKDNEPIFITKNGYSDLVVLSNELYESLIEKKYLQDNNSSIENDVELKNKEENYGYINIAASPIHIEIANPLENAKNIVNEVKTHALNNIQIAVFPELALTGYTCGDLFLNQSIKDACITSIKWILENTENDDVLFAFGTPFEFEEKLYNVAFVCYKGKVLGIVPKSHIPNYNEFYELRHFTPGKNNLSHVYLFNQKIPFSSKLLFKNIINPNSVIGVELCEDLWVNDSPSTELCKAGASIILNLSASNEIIGKEEYRKDLVKMASAKNICAYAYCSSSYEESTTDLLFSGACLISENGRIIKDSSLFEFQSITATIDLNLIHNRRLELNTFIRNQENIFVVGYEQSLNNVIASINYSKTPFIPLTHDDKKIRYNKILKMQALGLVRRMKHTNCKRVVLGLSGGLDSTLAYLVANKAMDILNYDHKNIIAITLPCFGTSSRTKQNAEYLARDYNTTFLEISIKDSVLKHLDDIKHDITLKDVTFENAQARERTQVLMDYANKVNGLVIGTGDLSEIALGWSTYNGDHMSMYGVNSSIPKTLIKDMIKILSEDSPSKETLLDILDTPVSPELLPPDERGNISQMTEDKVGPYILHDFFLYHFIRNHFSIKKIYFIAKRTFENEFSEDVIKKWLTVFVKRFFNQQFKRSCMPDGVKIGTVSLSPRGDLRMPSDASYKALIKELDELQ